MQARYRAWRIVPVTVICVLLLLGGATAALGDPLIVTVDGFCICHAPMFVGVAKGIFQKNGVDIRITYPATGFESLMAVHTGSAHIAAAAPAVVAQTLAQGVQLTGIFMAFGDATGKAPTDEYLAVVTRKPSGMREGHLEDLKGKTVGVPRGTIAHQYLYYALAAKGLDPTRDISIQPTPPAGLSGALESGSVDAIVIWEPVASQALRKVGDAFLLYRGGNHIQFLDLRVVSPQYLATNPGVVKSYIVAFAEAAQYVRLHPDEATDILMNEVKGLPRETVRKAVGLLGFDLRVSKATAQAAQQGFEFASGIGALKQAPAFEGMIDLTLFKQVLTERPELFKDLPPIPDALKR